MSIPPGAMVGYEAKKAELGENGERKMVIEKVYAYVLCMQRKDRNRAFVPVVRE